MNLLLNSLSETKFVIKFSCANHWRTILIFIVYAYDVLIYMQKSTEEKFWTAKQSSNDEMKKKKYEKWVDIITRRRIVGIWIFYWNGILSFDKIIKRKLRKRANEVETINKRWISLFLSLEIRINVIWENWKTNKLSIECICHNATDPNSAHILLRYFSVFFFRFPLEDKRHWNDKSNFYDQMWWNFVHFFSWFHFSIRKFKTDTVALYIWFAQTMDNVSPHQHQKRRKENRSKKLYSKKFCIKKRKRERERGWGMKELHIHNFLIKL